MITNPSQRAAVLEEQRIVRQRIERVGRMLSGGTLSSAASDAIMRECQAALQERLGQLDAALAQDARHRVERASHTLIAVDDQRSQSLYRQDAKP